MVEVDPSTQWIAIGALGTLVMAVVIGITLIFQVLQTKSLKNQTLVSNFSVITNYTGDPLTRTNRRILYKFYGTDLMKRLIEKYPNLDHDKELEKLNESLKQIGAMYERVGFLLDENKELQWKFIEYHGFTIGIMWKIFESINKLNKDKDKSKGYVYFEKIGNSSYNRWRTNVDEFLNEKIIQNKNRNGSEIIEIEKL